MTVKNITLHHSAGNHTQTFPAYQFGIQGDGTVVQNLSVNEKGAHTWGRNTGNVGISLCAMAPGFPVTPAQREACAVLIACLCGMFGLDIGGKIELPEMKVIGERIVATGHTMMFPVVNDHAGFAKADGYFPDRWDIGPEYAPIMARAKVIRAEIVAGKRANVWKGKVR